MTLYFQALPRGNGNQGLLSQANVPRGHFVTEQGAVTGAILTQKRARAFIKEALKGRVEGVRLDERDVASLQRAVGEAGLVSDTRALYKQLLDYIPHDNEESAPQGFSVRRGPFDQPFAITAEIQRSGEPIAMFPTLRNAIADLDAIVVRTDQMTASTAVTLLTQMVELGLASDEEEVQERFAAVSKEDRDAFIDGLLDKAKIGIIVIS